MLLGIGNESSGWSAKRVLRVEGFPGVSDAGLEPATNGLEVPPMACDLAFCCFVQFLATDDG
jgi:hypothetical protein